MTVSKEEKEKTIASDFRTLESTIRRLRSRLETYYDSKDIDATMQARVIARNIEVRTQDLREQLERM